MIVLAFDTATPETVVGLTGAGSPVALRHTPAPGERPGHAQQLLPLANRALAQAGLQWREVDRIGVGVGPGTFTGLRIGVATARALAQSSGAEVAGVSTLEALCVAASAGHDGAVLAVLDARRGEAFVAAWRGPERVLAAAAVAPGELAACAAPEHGPWLAVGDGALRFRAQLEPAGVRVPDDESPLHLIDPAALCALAERAAPADRETLIPDYVRAPDAELRVRDSKQ